MTSRHRFALTIAATWLLGFPVMCSSASPPSPAPTPAVPPFACKSPSGTGAPLTVFISDLHFGLGRLNPDKWNPLEDFRWTNALTGFLNEVSQRSTKKTTLVIAGDMLEMWQHPDIACSSGDADHGCTMDEMKALADTILGAHKDDLEALGRFANDGENHLVIIPGNHDAALLKSEINGKLLAALKGAPGRVEVVANGVWASPDCAIVSEHGHQMPNEQINGWKSWPDVTEVMNGTEYFRRPWGEYFVHKLYDRVEKDNSLIDNLIPQSNGVRHYMKKQGTLESAKDIARFLAFNIGEASIRQVADLNVKQTGPPAWDVPKARALGWRLYASAAPEEAYRAELQNVADATWDPIRSELDALANDPDSVSAEDIKSLCDKSAVNQPPRGICPTEQADLAISAIAGAIPGASYRATVKHLSLRAHADPFMRVFVYGHTHELRCPVPVTVSGGLPVVVANTGAFQRLIDDVKFITAAKKKNLTPEDGLGKLTLEGDAPPCYTAVLVTYKNGQPVASVQNWYMNESDATGKFVDPTDCLCAKLDPKCLPKKACN